MSERYMLELTKEQASVVSLACEFYARIGYGQFQEILFSFFSWKDNDASERKDKAEDYLFKARAQVFPGLGEQRGRSYGVGRDVSLDRSYDVHQVLRHALGDRREPWTNLDELPVCKVIREVDG